MKSKILSGILWGGSEKFIAQLVNFSLMLYLSYRLLPSDFALIGLVNIFIIFSDTLATTGVSSFLIHKGSESKGRYFPSAFFLSVSSAVLITTIILMFNGVIARYYNQETLSLVIPFMLISVVLNSISSIYRADILIKLGFSLISKVAIISNISSAIIGFSLAFKGAGYWALASLPVVKAVIAFLLLSKGSELKLKMKFDVGEFKEIYSFGYKVLLSGIIVIVSNGLVVLIGSRVLSVEEVGFYSLALSYVTFFSSTIGLLIQKITYPILSNIKKEKRLYEESLNRIIFFTSLISLPCMIGIASISKDFIYLFLGEKWAPMCMIIFFLSLSKALWPVVAINSNIYNSLGFPSLTLINELFKLFVTVFVVVVFIREGVTKVSMLQAFVSVFLFLFSAFLSGKVSSFGVLKQVKIIIPSLFSSFIMFSLIYFVEFENLYLQMALKIIFGVFVYSTLMYFPVRKMLIKG
ncbi:oligosaccharide flippase family protein [Vibrio sp. B181a]|uniref:oligosaccharide flippase family protein n=1 Tax=Vibrio sp. B181a TaxID=2835906 RepID=UPI0025538CA0|nr:oligosaccharide flippase family protein [Vibrio sp. B181a]MDK9773426.1 oligosaccharide flippase family protein [Vibrio sp. B181a]